MAKDSSVFQLKAWVPISLHHRLKVEAARRRQTITEMVVEGMTAYLKNNRKPEEKSTNG